eukprot:CAMPEP_0175640662 /NCGR_PEP_ID=MMETSP0097-20121207/4362_1 /TAXON_ID=311494 /ORGANISM="Alexandrium monilatum, Strain CCMP3105" /LENGTH=76 /DNA_ID=CAMNT_0016946417 /DNA_START=32 /DNA_END=258 /DNA_ORIENTATION=+
MTVCAEDCLRRGQLGQGPKPQPPAPLRSPRSLDPGAARPERSSRRRRAPAEQAGSNAVPAKLSSGRTSFHGGRARA